MFIDLKIKLIKNTFNLNFDLINILIFFYGLLLSTVPYFAIMGIPIDDAILTLIICLYLILSFFLKEQIKNKFLSCLIFFIYFFILYDLFFQLSPNMYKEFLNIILCINLFNANFFDKKKTYLFFYSLITGGVVSCCVAILQSLDFNFAWELRFLFELPNNWTIGRAIVNKEIPAGLSFFSIQLSYIILLIMPLIFFLIKNLIFKTILITLLIYTSFVISSESTIFLILFFLFYQFFLIFHKFSKISTKKILIIFISLITLSLILFVNEYKNFKNIQSLNSRISIYKVNYELIIQNPLGFSNYFTSSDYYNAKKELINAKYNKLENASEALRNTPHNIFLNCAIIWGLPITIIWFVVIGVLFFNFRNYLFFKIFPTDTNRYLFASIFSFTLLFAKSLLHNSSLINGDIFTWAMLAFAINQINLENTTHSISNKKINHSIKN